MDLALQDLASRPWGRFQLRVWRSGRLVELIDEPNLIVVGSQQAHAQTIAGDSGGFTISTIGYGTSLAAPLFANTTLTAPFTKPLDSHTYPAANQVAFAFSLLSNEANGMAIGEFGLLLAGGALYARKVRSAALAKDTDLSLSGVWTVSF